MALSDAWLRSVVGKERDKVWLNPIVMVCLLEYHRKVA